MAANELAIANALALAGAPVVPPAGEVGDCLYRVADRDVTFWKYEPQEDSHEADSRSIALVLFELHTALDTLRTVIAVPSYDTQVVDAIHSLANQKFAPELRAEDRAVLHRALSLGRQRLPGLANTDRIIHGSPHRMNILVVEGSPRFIDFETVQVGPIEWDIAHLEPDVASRYPAPLDVDALALCRLIISAATSTWCWGGLDRGPDMLNHAEGHLAIVRSWLDEEIRLGRWVTSRDRNSLGEGGELRMWAGPKGPANSMISKTLVRCAKGRCGTSLRSVSSLGLRPSHDPPGGPNVAELLHPRGSCSQIRGSARTNLRLASLAVSCRRREIFEFLWARCGHEISAT
jgi:hypothetical protein